MAHVENLVLEGGGVRGLAFVGCIQALEELGILKNIKRVAGSSAGAFTAMLISMNFTAEQFRDVWTATDFKKFSDADKGVTGFFRNIWRIYRKYAWNPGDILLKGVGDILEKYAGDRKITFKQMHEKYGKELIVTGTDVKRAQTVYFHHISYPDVEVRMAVRASMAIPFYFCPVILDDMFLVDGGVLCNYPIFIFDNEGDLPDHMHCCQAPCSNIDEITYNQKTLGLKLMGSNEKPDQDIFHGVMDVSMVHLYASSLIDCMGWAIERLGIKDNNYWLRTVDIPTFEIKSTDFDITQEQKDLLCKSGYDSTKSFFVIKKECNEETDSCTLHLNLPVA